ncbi:MAG: DUF2358 domain-containing protein [Gloeomargaritaceae cyanobacterium C42_A2020_066]|nr:DUF2358 domain-containing protein [Gloeomargaritaceae cyanobacterium C42_A2020_066]
MDILDALRADYARFPDAPSYHLYAEDVRFEDPMNRFQGLDRYRAMIGFMTTWFRDIRLDLHSLARQDEQITSRWTLSWQAPLPWQPRIRISGWSELHLNPAGRIDRHVDYWDCSRLDVLRQHFFPKGFQE